MFGDLKGSLKDARAALQLTEDTESEPETHALLCMINIILRDSNTACKHARSATKKFDPQTCPRLHETYQAKFEGLLAYTMRRFPIAIEKFSLAAETLPHDDLVLVYLKSKAEWYLGEEDSAIDEIQSCVEKCPNFGIAKFDLENIKKGNVKRKKGKVSEEGGEGGITTEEELNQIFPQFPEEWSRKAAEHCTEIIVGTLDRFKEEIGDDDEEHAEIEEADGEGENTKGEGGATTNPGNGDVTHPPNAAAETQKVDGRIKYVHHNEDNPLLPKSSTGQNSDGCCPSVCTLY